MGSIRRDLARPAALAAGVALLVGAAIGMERPGLGSALVIPAVFVIALALLFSIDRIGRLEHTLAELRVEAVALWSLTPLGSPGGVILPTLGGYALSPAAAAALLAHVVAAQPATVVELGPGSSTVLLLRLSATLDSPPSITCLEHQRPYLDKVKNAVHYHGGTTVELIDAALTPLEIDGWHGRWYDSAALKRIPATIDFLVVDGPPESAGSNARYPAYPILGPMLSDGALIFVDDTGRDAERSMVDRWIAMGGLTMVHDGGSFQVLRKLAH